MITSIRSKIVLLTACVALPATGLFAQAPATTSTPSVSVPASTDPTTTTATTATGKHGEKMRERLSSLTPEERQTLKAAHEKAKQDPAVKAAEATRETDKKGFHKTMAEAMVRADPAVAPILKKMHGEGRHANKES